MTFTTTLVAVVLPVLAIVGFGFLYGRKADVDNDALADITLYVLAPALVFYSMATTNLRASQIVVLIVGVGLVTVGMAIIGEAVALFGNISGPTRNGLVLASTFSNCGNFGIPLSTFAFGEIGRNTAVLYLVAQNIFMYTLGVYLAARDSASSNVDSIREIFRLPLIYALVAAIILRQFNLVPSLETTVMETIELTGNAAIPVMLLLVGIQLADTDHHATPRQIALPNLLRFGIAPIVAVGIALAIGFTDNTVARVFILESSMPVAVTPLILAMEYDTSEMSVTTSEYLSTAIFTTTLLSIPISAFLITLLQSGVLI